MHVLYASRVLCSNVLLGAHGHAKGSEKTATVDVRLDSTLPLPSSPSLPSQAPLGDSLHVMEDTLVPLRASLPSTKSLLLFIKELFSIIKLVSNDASILK